MQHCFVLSQSSLAISCVRDGHRNRKSQKPLRCRGAKLIGKGTRSKPKDYLDNQSLELPFHAFALGCFRFLTSRFWALLVGFWLHLRISSASGQRFNALASVWREENCRHLNVVGSAAGDVQLGVSTSTITCWEDKKNTPTHTTANESKCLQKFWPPTKKLSTPVIDTTFLWQSYLPPKSLLCGPDLLVKEKFLTRAGLAYLAGATRGKAMSQKLGNYANSLWSDAGS